MITEICLHASSGVRMVGIGMAQHDDGWVLCL